MCTAILTLTRLQAGDHDEFRRLVEQCRRPILRVVQAILRNEAEAEEIAQDVFAKVWVNLPRFDGRCAILSWIYRIALNEAFAHLRKRRPKLVFESEEALRRHPDRRAGAERRLTDRDLALKLLARVPAADRLLLTLKEVEGLSLAEICALTEMRESTVKTKLFRARRRLLKIASGWNSAAGARDSRA